MQRRMVFSACGVPSVQSPEVDWHVDPLHACGSKIFPGTGRLHDEFFMEKLLSEVLKKIDATRGLRELPLPPQIARVRYPLGWLLVNNYTWAGDRIRKLYANRVTLRLPFLDVMGNGLYPTDEYEAPIFIFDISMTKKKVVTYINLVKMGDGQKYDATYIEPFRDLSERYHHLGSQSMPEWMQRHQSPNGIYAMPPAEKHQDVRACVMDYLDRYLQVLGAALALPDGDARTGVRRRREAFVHDLVTYDRAQQAMGRLIGRKRLQLFQQHVLGA